MVEETQREEAMLGVHPVLPALALAFKADGGDGGAGDRGCGHEVVSAYEDLAPARFEPG